MNDMEKFLNFGAVVKVKRSNDDELWKFIKLIKSVVFLDEYINHFQNSCCTNKQYSEYTEDEFWHLVELNCKDKYNTCLEFQWGKGFTFDDEKNYTNYDPEIKIISVDELIKSCNKENEFKLNYRYTSFDKELEDKKIAKELDDFICFYDWSIVKFPNNEFNIKDEQTNSFDFDENITDFKEIISRVYYRMFDYFLDEEDIEGLLYGGEYNYVKERFDSYIDTGKKLELIDDVNIKQYDLWINDVTERAKKYDIELNIDI